MSTLRSRRRPISRLTLSCSSCKDGKLKCDRSVPVCGQCYKRSKEATCQYTERGLRHNTEASKSNSVTSTVKEKIERIENFIQGLREPYSQALPITPPGLRATETGSGSLDTRADHDEQVSDWSTTQNWQSVIDDIAAVKADLEYESTANTSTVTSTNTTHDRHEHGPLPEPQRQYEFISEPVILNRDEVLKRLPHKSEMDHFLATWSVSTQPAGVTVQMSHFQQQYEAFWLDAEHVTSPWLAFMLSAASFGAEITGQQYRSSITLRKAVYLRQLSENVLADMNRPKPYLVETLLLNNILRGLHKSGSSFTSMEQDPDHVNPRSPDLDMSSIQVSTTEPINSSQEAGSDIHQTDLEWYSGLEHSPALDVVHVVLSGENRVSLQERSSRSVDEVWRRTDTSDISIDSSGMPTAFWGT